MPTLTEKNIKKWLLGTVKPDEFIEKDLKVAGVLFEAVVPQSKILETAKEYLSQGYFLESLTAVDFEECFELVYHFNLWGPAQRICVKVLVPKKSNSAPM